MLRIATLNLTLRDSAESAWWMRMIVPKFLSILVIVKVLVNMSILSAFRIGLAAKLRRKLTLVPLASIGRSSIVRCARCLCLIWSILRTKSWNLSQFIDQKTHIFCLRESFMINPKKAQRTPRWWCSWAWIITSHRLRW